jgi:protein gp37
MSKIEWTERTWNFLIGCTLKSKGCENCYAMRMAYRLQHNPLMKEKYEGVAKKTAGGKILWTGKINVDEERLLLPLQVKKPTTWFVNSMSDLFHEDVEWNVIYKAFDVMLQTPQHTYQILTKRPDIMLKHMKKVYFHLQRNYPRATLPLPNVWLVVSVEDQKAADERIPLLSQVPAAVRGLSCEPLLAKIYVCGTMQQHAGPDIYYNHLQNIDWVVCGGESGPGARPMHPEWARSLRDQCNAAGVPFFFKQWGEYIETDQLQETATNVLNKKDLFIDGNYFFKVGKKKAGRLLDGKEWSEYPVI